MTVTIRVFERVGSYASREPIAQRSSIRGNSGSQGRTLKSTRTTQRSGSPRTDAACPVDGVSAADGSFSSRLDGKQVTKLVLRMLGELLTLLLVVSSLSFVAREQCERLARTFWQSFGYAGLGLGTFLADAFQFPVPPQFYMLLGEMSGASRVSAFAAIAPASVVAGAVGYELSQRLGELRWVARRTQRWRAPLHAAFERYGYRTAFVASLLPIPYSLLCYLAGLNRMPRRFLALLAVCRVPKLVLFFVLVALGWRVT